MRDFSQLNFPSLETQTPTNFLQHGGEFHERLFPTKFFLVWKHKLQQIFYSTEMNFMRDFSQLNFPSLETQTPKKFLQHGDEFHERLKKKKKKKRKSKTVCVYCSTGIEM